MNDTDKIMFHCPICEAENPKYFIIDKYAEFTGTIIGCDQCTQAVPAAEYVLDQSLKGH